MTFVTAAKGNKYSALQTRWLLIPSVSLSICIYHLSLPWFLNPIAWVSQMFQNLRNFLQQMLEERSEQASGSPGTQYISNAIVLHYRSFE